VNRNATTVSTLKSASQSDSMVSHSKPARVYEMLPLSATHEVKGSWAYACKAPRESERFSGRYSASRQATKMRSIPLSPCRSGQ